MSCYEEESGTYTLPTVEVPKLHSALRDHTNTVHAQVRAEVQRLHKLAGGTRSVKKYAEAMRGHAQFDSRYDGMMFGFDVDADPVSLAATEVIDRMLTAASRGEKGIHKPTLAEIEFYAPKATNRTKTFTADHETMISFDGRRVTWSVMENNHSVDRAHDTDLARIFWGYLDGISWTRNSGGSCLYGNEYSRELGGGGDSETNLYGPLGGQPTGVKPKPQDTFLPLRLHFW